VSLYDVRFNKTNKELEETIAVCKGKKSEGYAKLRLDTSGLIDQNKERNAALQVDCDGHVDQLHSDLKKYKDIIAQLTCCSFLFLYASHMSYVLRCSRFLYIASSSCPFRK
jgi:hypothetical protein